MTTKQAYDDAFADELVNQYPAVDAFEKEMGFALDDERMLPAAQILACPVKVNPPNWQHGRVIYAAARRYIQDIDEPYEDRLFLDVGTAKGFSSLCLRWALNDAESYGHVVSIDVIDPYARQNRNTVAEVDGPKTLYEILAPFPDARRVKYERASSIEWLKQNTHRVHFAFLDGKHRNDVVEQEISWLIGLQQPGDMIVLDDLQIPGVAQAARNKNFASVYSLRTVEAKAQRRYGIMVRQP